MFSDVIIARNLDIMPRSAQLWIIRFVECVVQAITPWGKTMMNQVNHYTLLNHKWLGKHHSYHEQYLLDPMGKICNVENGQ